MKITVNGKATEVAEQLTASQLLESLDLVGKRLAIEVNRELVPRSRFEQHQLHDGDQVEIVHAIGGG